VGDQIISNGSIWQKIPVTNAVQSVNGKTGIVVVNKNDVVLGNVDNTSDATKNSASATLTNKTIDGANNTLNVRLNTTDVSGNLPVTKLNSGTNAGTGTFWRGDGTWVAPAGAGDVQGPAASVDSEVTLFSGTTGKLLKRATGTGIVLVTSGVYQTPQATLPYANWPNGSILQVVAATPMTTFQGTTLAIPYDDTIPQWGEGDVLISVSITLKVATSKIYLHCSGYGTVTASGFPAITALFRGTGPGAFSSRAMTPGALNYLSHFVVDGFDTPGAGTFTYTVRYGTLNGTYGFNVNGGTAGSPLFGGTSQVNLYAQEIKA
jgi:hypothetical protein